MQKIYILKMTIMNGTVPIKDEISAYTCAEMRSAVREKVEEANKNSDVKIQYSESESYLYESIGEVPIMAK